MKSESTIPTNCNKLLYEIFYYYTYFCHAIAHFGKIFFFTFPYIIKLRGSFVRPSENQSVYMLTLKQTGLQL